MGNDNNGGRNYCGWWIFYTLIGFVAWIALMIAKVCGAVRINWPTAILGIVWVPMFMFAIGAALLGVVELVRVARRRIREWKRRRKIAWTLRESMEGLTLNSIGPVYGVKRQPGEKNRSYKRRILKAARTVDTVNVQRAPEPATGEKLDRIAKRHNLKRRPGETDAQLQGRIKEAALAELKGGGQNG